VRSLTLQAPGSPYGYGGTQGAAGKANYDDCAGSGGGLISPEVIARYLAKDESADSPYAPRSGLRQLYVKPGFTYPPEWEDALVEQMLMMVIGDQYYPGDGVDSPNWPFKGPGVYGANNALAPKYCDLSGLGDLRDGPPILWVRGADDKVVADAALGDTATLGQLGVIPGWPGAEVCPPQPMLAQLRATLDRYAAGGGSYREEVLPDCGHSPCIEHPEAFRDRFTAFMRASGGSGSQPAREAAPGIGSEPTATETAPGAASDPVATQPAPAEPATTRGPAGGAPVSEPAPPHLPANPAPSPVASDMPAPASPPAPPRRRGFFAALFGRQE
ncbi:MAG TPA: hypothetical protein VGN32_14860, partial [Ktedonobacterales bacterium]|nr:hypothetical protein [Ktedonobacterales bacterium]